MREVVHARSIKFLRVRNDRLSSGRILCDKEIFFPYDRFTGYKKSNQNQSGRALPFAFALTCYKIYFLYSSLSDFDLFRWRVHLSDGVCRLRARVQLKTLSSLLKGGEIRDTKTLNLSRNIVSLQVLVDVSRFSPGVINLNRNKNVCCGLKKCSALIG